ncbi:hypothetical protein ACFGVS_03375 [Mucilaginibacter sp. AW1-7]|uniref:hypothetical protein n=1 Tax=Mucilaginibacter sp. AW1-7 TaxID=3349874 RepID=UPI003F73743D
MAKHLKEVKALIADPKSQPENSKSGKLVAGYAFNDTLQRFFNSVSGTVIKSGVVQSASAVLDDKSLTVNYTIPFKKAPWLTIQPTITGSSSKGVIDLFTGDKFAKTLTGGINFNKFIKGTGYYPKSKKINFLYHLKKGEKDYGPVLYKYRKEKSLAVDALIKFCDDSDNALVFSEPKLTDSTYADYFNKRAQLHLLLVELKDFFPEKMDTTDMAQVKLFANDFKVSGHKNALLDYKQDVKAVKFLDSLQTSAPFSHFRYIWFTLSPKLNQKDYPIYDPGNVAKDYTKTESDFYFSVTGSLNWLWSWKKFKVLVYPGLTLSNARVYDPADSIGLSIQKNYIPGDDNVKSVKSTGFYPVVADRQWVKSITLPVMLYWTKGMGIDAAAGLKLQSGANDFNARLGFFFNIPTTKGESITLEPLIKYDNDKSKVYDRNFDKFTMGFSVSFAVPAYLTGK